MDTYIAERDQNQNLVIVKNGGKVCQVKVMPDDSLAEMAPESWVFDFCRTVSQTELENAVAAAQAGIE